MSGQLTQRQAISERFPGTNSLGDGVTLEAGFLLVTVIDAGGINQNGVWIVIGIELRPLVPLIRFPPEAHRMKILPCGGVKVSNRPAAHGKLSTHRRSLGIEGEERKLITDKGADKVRVTVGLLGEPGVFDQGVDVDTVEKFLVLALYTFVLVADSQAPAGQINLRFDPLLHIPVTFQHLLTGNHHAIDRVVDENFRGFRAHGCKR